MHKVSKDIQKAMKSAKDKWENCYILKMDITKFFQNFDSRTLWDILKKIKIRDRRLLWLI